MLCQKCLDCKLLGAATVAYGAALDNGEEEAIDAAEAIYGSFLCPECYEAVVVNEGEERECKCDEPMKWEGGGLIWDCGRVYECGPCLGTMETQDDGTIECDGCYAIANQVVERGGELILTNVAELGDYVQAVQTNLNNEN